MDGRSCSCGCSDHVLQAGIRSRIEPIRRSTQSDQELFTASAATTPPTAAVPGTVKARWLPPVAGGCLERAEPSREPGSG